MDCFCDAQPVDFIGHPFGVAGDALAVIAGQGAAPPSRGGPSIFDACQIGVVLRTVLFVEAVVAVATLFVASTPGRMAAADGDGHRRRLAGHADLAGAPPAG